MASSNPLSAFKTKVGRSVTKKWREANHISYDGDDWGDDDEDDDDGGPAPVSAEGGGYPRWGPPPNVYASNRSVTNPSPSRLGGRASFDHGDDRRVFSSTAGFDSPYPTSQRAPFPDPQHDFEPSSPNFRDHPPLRVNTTPQGSMPPGNFRPGSRGRQYPPYDAPIPMPGGFPQQRRSGSSNRPPPGDIFQRHESPMRPDSRASNASARQFPPRKTSLSQQQAPQMDFTQRIDTVAPTQSSGSDDNNNHNEDKPIPVFVRPSDIYKRMPQEMEKVRKSQESSRPSIDTITGRVRERSIGAGSVPADPIDVTNTIPRPVDDSDSTRRLKPTLDPVPERKSEYGFDNILKASDAPNLSTEPANGEGDANVSRHPTTSSSVYTDRPDPVSASSISRNVSLSDTIPEDEPQQPSPARPSFALPAIGRVSGFGMDFGASALPIATESQQPSRELPAVAELKSTDEKTVIRPDVQGLQHQPSFGYRSIVQQAFDESENQGTLSPVSPYDSVDRSNSASTSDISPVIARQPEHPTTSEEPIKSDSRPTSTATVRPNEMQTVVEEEDFPAPIPIRTGYRRSVTPPSRDNSPAKRPLSLDAPVDAQPQQGAIVSEQDEERAGEIPDRGRTLEDQPLPADPPTDSIEQMQSSEASLPPSDNVRSEVEQEWQAHKEKFNAQNDSRDSGEAVPDVSALVKRSETPTRGTVRDLAGKLESLSGRSTPSNLRASSPHVEQGRPPPQARLDTFRPSIPGGWQSFTSTIGAATHASTITPQHLSEPLVDQPRPQFTSTRGESSESIPTARAPVDLADAKDSITQRAFAAAASAGNALAESLTGQHPIEHVDTPQGASENSSENEWDASSSSSKQDPDPVTSKGQRQEEFQREQPEDVAETSITSPPAGQVSGKRSPSESAPITPLHAKDWEADEAPTNSDSYFPAPLRTTRMSALVSRPPIPELSVSEESPSESDNDRLQVEIERKLTPKSSNLDDANEVRTTQIENSMTSGESLPLSRPAIESGKTQSEIDIVTQTEAPSKAVRQTDQASNVQAPPLIDEQAPTTTDRPFLQQRFSWETQPEQEQPVTPQPMSPQSSSSPETIKVASQPEPISIDTYRPEANSRGNIDQESNFQAPPTFAPEPTHTRTDVVEAPDSSPSQLGPATFRAIMKLGTPQDRIRAFDETRRVLARPDGQLEEWMLSLSSSDHSELYALNGRVSQDTADTTISHKPSPRRIFTESTGARHMQEDGKKLMAAAGRFGGKAGIAAKGLFAKGKEKMRHASAGEKGFLSNRRKSPGPEPEDAGASSQARNSTVLAEPPRIPLSIPTDSVSDWFSGPEFQGSPTSEVRSPVLPGRTSSSTVSVDRDVIKVQRPGQPEEDGSGDGPTVAVAPPAVPSSPTISAPDSERFHDNAAPSRSISQVTRPTAEDSPVEAVQPQQAEEGIESEPGLLKPQPTVGPPDHVDLNHLAAPDVSVAPPGVADDRTLDVPRDRPQSIISEVSSVSPGPGPDSTQIATRHSVSPADESPRISEPEVGEDAQESNRDSRRADVLEHKQPNIGATAQYTRPPHEGQVPESGEVDVEPAMGQPRTEDDPQNLPQEQSQYDESSPRPFSFVGLEGIGEIHQPPQASPDRSRVASPPWSPVSQPISSRSLSKELSQVSAEDVPDSAQAGGPGQSRSYSRPFGADPNVRNHPAIRSPGPEQAADDRARMYSSENPLPSARRPQTEVERFRQPREQHSHYHIDEPQTQPAEEPEFRIPGPYVQEYRSPKHISTPKTARSQTQVQASGTPLPSTARTQRYSAQTYPQPPRPVSTAYVRPKSVTSESYRGPVDEISKVSGFEAHDHLHDNKPQTAHDEQVIASRRQLMGPPPVPNPPPDRPKRGVLGGLFGLGSKPRSKLQKSEQGKITDGHGAQHQKEKRNSLFRRNSRQDSISSQRSSQYGAPGGLDEAGQLPPAKLQSHFAKRQSRELLRTPTPEQPSEAKKKRFSGLGNRLFKSGGGSRASTAPTPPTQESSVPTIGQPGSRASQTVMSPQTYAQYDVDPGRYYTPESGQWRHARPDSRHSLSQQHQQQQEQLLLLRQSPRTALPYQHQRRPVSYPYPTEEPPQFHGPRRVTRSPYSDVEQNQQRPSDLRIDTGERNHSAYGLPATAPAQIYPAENRSFVATNSYDANPSPRIPNTMASRASARSSPVTRPPAPLQPQPQPPQPHGRAHVLDLHKRSRSPRLGRKGSDEFDQAGAPAQASGSGPVEKLGTFSSKKISPVGGIPRSDDDQERPYAIDVPGLDNDDDGGGHHDQDHDHDHNQDHNQDHNRGRSNNRLLPARTQGPGPFVASRGQSETSISGESSGHNGQPGLTAVSVPGSGGVVGGNGNSGGFLDRNVSLLEGTTAHISNSAEHRRSTARDVTSSGAGGFGSGFIAELPGSRAEGYESEEEIPMSATAYPGQEWVPVIVGDGRWDD